MNTAATNTRNAPLDLAAIESRALAASTGWYVNTLLNPPDRTLVMKTMNAEDPAASIPGTSNPRDVLTSLASPADAEFIAHSRDDVLALIGALVTAQTELAASQAMIEKASLVYMRSLAGPIGTVGTMADTLDAIAEALQVPGTPVVDEPLATTALDLVKAGARNAALEEVAVLARSTHFTRGRYEARFGVDGGRLADAVRALRSAEPAAAAPATATVSAAL
jgi:hypothetical protein